MDSPLPVHPLTGDSALGWRKARPGEDDDQLYPVWPIRGGAADDGEDDDGEDPGEDPGDDAEDGADDGDGTDGTDSDGQDDDADPDGADQLGDRGKRALAAMKSKWRSERDKRRELEQKMPGQGDDAVAKATAAATTAANTRILKAEVRAAAKGRLADPKDALTFLDLSAFEVDEDGSVDEDEIADAIEDLLKNKPYLAAATAKRFQGTGDGGAARKAGRPKQLRASDLKTMTAEQIVKAQDAGQLDDYLGAG